MLILRPHQERALERRADLMRCKKKRLLIVSPTGSGKTVIAAESIKREPGEPTLFLAPRRELIYQTSRKLAEIGVPHGIILAGEKKGMNLYSRVQVASRDTLISRALRNKKLVLPNFTRVYVDEAHIGLSGKFQSLAALWPDATFTGLTATPCRSDGKALGMFYEDMIEVATVKELTDQGYLVPAEFYSVSEPDLRGVRTTAGDYNEGDLNTIMNQPKLVGDVVEHWLQHAAERRTVVFATSIAHSLALTKEFIEHGVSAEHVDATTPQNARDQIFERFKLGITQVLVNCTLASVGFDLPDLDCVVFARPTKSLGLYLQMLGRGLRTAPGKKDCLVLDHAGNWHRHGSAIDDRFWTLDGRYALDAERTKAAKEKRQQESGVVEITCPVCKYSFEGSRQCPKCGYWFQQKAKAIETREGQLVKMDGKQKPDTPEQRMKFFLELSGYGDMKSYSPGWASHKFREKYGDWPEWKWKQHAEKHGGLDPSIETIRWVKSRIIAHAKSRKAKERREEALLDNVPY